MVVELVKAGGNTVTPDHRLTYINERPDEVRFFVPDKGSNGWKEKPLKSLKTRC